LRKISQITDKSINTRHCDLSELKNDPDLITTKYSSQTVSLNSGNYFNDGGTASNEKIKLIKKMR